MKPILNCLPTPRSDKDFLAIPVSSVTHLPLQVDLEDQMPPVFHQLGLGACTANAAAALRDFMQLYRAQVYAPTSRAYIYWHEREIEGTLGEDAGAYTRNALVVLYRYGVCEEYYFPYSESTYNNTPTTTAEINAPRYKISEYHRLLVSPQVMESLSEAQPVLMGFTLFSSFWNIDNTGIVPMPNQQTDIVQGGHCVLLIGYKYIGDKLYFKARNSWGSSWGDRGHFWISAEYIDSPWIFDLWAGTVNTPWSDITYEQAIYILTKDQHIYESADTWLALGRKYEGDNTSDFRYLQLLFRKFAADCQNFPPLTSILDYASFTYTDALSYLSSKMVMASPDFWINLWNKYSGDPKSDFRFLALAIIKYAARRKLLFP